MVTNLEEAVFKAKEFISKMKGLDVKVTGRNLIDCLDFELNKKTEQPAYYSLFVSLNENLYSSNRVKYRIDVNKLTGDIDDFERNFEK